MANHVASLDALKGTLETLQENKPKDRSETDRDYQIVITDMEKLIAFFEHRIVEGKR